MPRRMRIGFGSGGPSWFTALPDKTWATIASSGTVSAVAPSSPGGTEGVSAVMADWCGACIDTTRGTFVIPSQGGHSGYYGNEVYVLDPNVETPAWTRVTNPSSSFGTGSAMSDGNPRSVHSGGQICYAPNTDRIYLTSMPYTAPVADSFRDMYAFDPVAKTWVTRAILPSGWGDNSYADGGSAYDSVNETIWCINSNAYGSVSQYNPVGNSHTYYGGALLITNSYNASVSLSPTKRCVIVLNGYGGDILSVLDLSNPSGGWMTPTKSGSWPTGNGPGLVWHGPSGAFISWGSGSSLYKLVPPVSGLSSAWTGSVVSAAGGVTPSSPQANGTYGRFNLISNFGGSGRDLIIMVNAVTEATYVYKLPAAGL